jgi:hypothetical protein
MRTVLVSAALAIAACQSAAPKPAIENVSTRPPQPVTPTHIGDPEHPYIFANACTDSMPHACDVRECMAWKQGHGEPEDVAFGECLQDCNCGE